MSLPPPNGESSVLVIGEALMDLVIRHGSTELEAEAVPGGSPANVAVALGRLGIPVELETWLGTDDFGVQITSHLKDSKVSVSDHSLGADATPKATAHLDESGAATYTFDLVWDPQTPLPIPQSAEIVHTGSIAAVIAPGGETVLQALAAAKEQALITYDPNARPQLMGDPATAREAIEQIFTLADVVKASDEDLEWLYPGRSAEASAVALADQFQIPLFVLTRGSKGAMGWSANGVVEVAPAPVKVVDTVGAGDTFMGGLIDALWRRNIKGRKGRGLLSQLSSGEVEAILEEAAQLADIVVQRQGANPPWASELGR